MKHKVLGITMALLATLSCIKEESPEQPVDGGEERFAEFDPVVRFGLDTYMGGADDNEPLTKTTYAGDDKTIVLDNVRYERINWNAKLPSEISGAEASTYTRDLVQIHAESGQEFGPNSPESLLRYICTRTGRNFRPGTQQLYSCLNFITLQFILEKVTGERLCDYAQLHVFDALRLKHTCYLPLNMENIAPTEVQPDGSVLRGQVHDPIARLVNAGNSGNAGVFSNVEDLAVISAALLNGGSYNGQRVLQPLTVQKMFTVPATNAPEVARALGWDTYYTGPYTSGDIFPLEQLRGHTGYTGTSILLSPDTNTAVIVLAHRVHPVDEGSASRLRSTVASIVAASILR